MQTIHADSAPDDALAAGQQHDFDCGEPGCDNAAKHACQQASACCVERAETHWSPPPGSLCSCECPCYQRLPVKILSRCPASAHVFQRVHACGNCGR